MLSKRVKECVDCGRYDDEFIIIFSVCVCVSRDFIRDCSVLWHVRKKISQ